MSQIETLLQMITTTEKGTVIAMIVDVEGSAYRKEGAWMVFQEDESPLGVISGGCLEHDLHRRAKELFHTGKTVLISYDMSAEDDLGWGRGAGCNGIVHILLRDINSSFRQSLLSSYQSLRNKEPILYIQSMEDFTCYIFSSKTDDVGGFWDDDADWEWLNVRPFTTIAGQRKFGDKLYFIQLLWPVSNLYIMGGGVDARPLTAFASEVGFHVHVFDGRENFCQPKYFPKAASLHHQNIGSTLERLCLTPLDSVVIMTHDFQYDVQLVDQLQKINLLYLGILGSEQRTKRLFKGRVPKHVHSPVGLSIGADGPEEIAISIVAELIAIKRGEIH